MSDIYCTIHQAEHMAWPGFWQKVARTNTFVILDDVQFKRRHFESRNKIRNKETSFWLTVPTVPVPQKTLMTDVEIKDDEKWIAKNLKSLEQAYLKAPYFDTVYPALEKVFKKQHKRLLDLNLDLIKTIMELTGIETKIILSSTLNVTSSSSDRILDICKGIKATKYLSGHSGKEYLDMEEFKKNGIGLEFQSYEQKEYPQNGDEFISHLSSIDYLFNCGPENFKAYLLEN